MMWAAVAVLAVGLMVFFWMRNKQREAEEIVSGVDPATGAPKNPDRELILKKGSKGVEVAELQRRLKRDGAGDLLGKTGPGKDGVDGDFGSKTQAALQQVKAVAQISLSQYDRPTAPLKAPLFYSAVESQNTGFN